MEKTEEKTKEKIKVFVSFDVENDESLLRRLDGQVKKRDVLLELAGWSVCGDITGDWKDKVRDKIKNVDQVIVICGKRTDVADGVNVELRIAREENIPYFFLWGRKGETCGKPREAKHDDKIYEWTWKNLNILLGSTRNIPSGPGVPPVIDKMISENFVNETIDKLSYGSDAKYQDHLLEQYKLYVEMADRTDSRRQKTDSFFLSINTVLTSLVSLIGLISLINPRDFFSIDIALQLILFFGAVIAIVGFKLNYLWSKRIQSYQYLNDTKSKIINKIEKFLPLNIYNVEKVSLERGKLYFPVIRIEYSIPLAFRALYGIVIVFILVMIFVVSL